MECKKVQQTLSAYLDKEVSDFETKKIERHLDKCKRCRSAYQTLKNTVDKLEYYPQIEADDNFTEEVMNKIEEENSLSDLVFEDWLNKFILSHKLITTIILLCFLVSAILIFTVANKLSIFIIGKVFYHLFSSSYFVSDSLTALYPESLFYLEGIFLISLVSFLFILKQIKEWDSCELNNKLNKEN
ncbi:anti-sigma factor family protein [Sporohalobacter salinus]|uniref:anti-sigma factor family protein n=1 Tax=Sporohalobacter salinus TaxID=1494606 RepID=UPI0019616F2B|nr:zf-HC2 domain-containing protein [Sporohalobacter salinus]MBM7624076.1 hypothetical protein [Sporohalobacter salinus]